MEDFSMNSFQQNIEKIFIYNNNKWKLIIEPSFDSFIINIFHSYYTYQNNFSYTYLKTIFECVNNLNEIINIILKLIDENEFKIEEDDKTVFLEFSSNIIFNLKRIENKNIIDILIEEIKTIKDENISMKEKMGRICDEIENKNKEIEILKGRMKLLEEYIEDEVNSNKSKKIIEEKEEEKSIKLIPNSLKQNFKTLKNHIGYINHLSILNDGRLASCSDDCTLNIYKKESFELQLSIKPHSDWVYSFTQLNDGRIIACCADKTMKIIKLLEEDKYQIEESLLGHNDCVLKVIEIRENELISISKDNIMKVWILKENNQFEFITNIIFQNSESYCNIFKLNENEIATTSVGDKCIKFWNSHNYSNITTINDIETDFGFQTMCLVEKDLLCIGGTNSKGFYLIQISSHQVINIILGLKYIYSIYKCLNGDLLCAVIDENWNNTLVRYKYDGQNLEKIVEKENAHNSNIFSCVELNDGTIASGGSDKLIKLWK